MLPTSLTNKEFLALNSYRHHVATTRLMHSINVSYISWLTAKKLGCDAQAAARAGLLHDFFLYDPREGRPSRELQAFCHPKVAARTSGETFEISEKKGTPYCPICSRWAPSQIPGSMDYIRRGQNMRLCGSLPYYGLHWQETDAWQSARRKDEGFLSNCIKSAGEGAFQGAVSPHGGTKDRPGLSRADPLLFCPPIVKRPPLPAGPGSLLPALIVMQSVRLISGSLTSTC